MTEVLRSALIIQRDDTFLLVREGTPKVYGLWNWQQGMVEDGENVEDAAIREAKEETGFDVRIVRKICVIPYPFPGTKEIHVFLGNIVGGKLCVPDDEILEARWFCLNEIEHIKNQMTGAWVLQTISGL